MSRYRAALIGCGKIGSEYSDDALIRGIATHAEAYSCCPNTDLVAVCDIDYLKAKNCGEKWNVKHLYTDVSRLLQEQKPEIVSICTPNHTHGAILELALAAPSTKAVLSEKPLTMTPDEATTILALARRRNITVLVNYSRRFSTGHQKIRERLLGGEIGDIQFVSGVYTKGLIHNGTHWIDLAHWFFGSIKSLRGLNLRNQEENDGQVDACFSFQSGPNGWLLGLDANAYGLFEMDIFGTLGRIRILDSGHRLEISRVIQSPYYSGFKTLSVEAIETNDMENTILFALNELIRNIETPVSSTKVTLSAVEAIETAALLLASARRGGAELFPNLSV